MNAAWMVRAGRLGEREQDALNAGLVIVGWPELGDLSEVRSRRALSSMVRAAYPQRSRTVVANWTGQLWRLIRVMKPGDYVIMPLRHTPGCVALGQIAGDYEYRPDAEPGFRHVRRVMWSDTELPRQKIQQDLLYSLGSLLTVCQLRRNGAARRIAELARTGSDPGPTEDEMPGGDLVTPEDLLAEIAGSPTGRQITVRELLRAWGANRRTSQAVTRISDDLAEHALTTAPPFTEGWIDDVVLVVKSGAEADDSTVETVLEKVAEETDDDTDEAEETKPFTLRFGNLLRAGVALASVRPADSVITARTIMLRHNYSQLAIIDDDSVYYGAISWESIAKAHMALPGTPTCLQARQLAPEAQYDDLVLPRVDDIARHGFVFIRAKDRKTMVGIVTAADLANRFGEVAKPFTMIEECERRLQQRVGDAFSAEEIKKETKAKDADSMTFGSYCWLLKKPGNFEKLEWPLDHAQFMAQLEEVRRLRNRLMHFSPDPTPSGEWSAIDGLLAMLHAVDPLS